MYRALAFSKGSALTITPFAIMKFTLTTLTVMYFQEQMLLEQVEQMLFELILSEQLLL
jgi:hypothetical protein